MEWMSLNDIRENIAELCPKYITRDDIFATINYMLGLKYDIGCTDDIDHLGNRRIRSVGEQLQNQIGHFYPSEKQGLTIESYWCILTVLSHLIQLMFFSGGMGIHDKHQLS